MASTADQVEALAFAWLAREALAGRAGQPAGGDRRARTAGAGRDLSPIAVPEKENGSPRLPFRAGLRTRQAEKLDPQPQVVVAFGFLITNCAPSRPS